MIGLRRQTGKLKRDLQKSHEAPQVAKHLAKKMF
jgi:hypothetical protein